MFRLNCTLLLFLYLASGYSMGYKQPNIVMFLTDDQDVVLGGMSPMKNVQKLIAENGVTFSNYYTSSPICCPSRASILTGKYPHNHMTQNNSVSGGCYSPGWLKHEQDTFATELAKAGYSSFYAGKYLNEYGKAHTGGPGMIPPGWTEWHGLVGNSVYYNYTLSNNGVPTHSADLYLTDVIRDLALNYIDNQTERQPFLMVLSPPAPHQPFTPAKRHIGAFRNVTAVRHPNFNVESHDKHWLMRMPPSPLPESLLPELDKVYRTRWESLLAVDEMVAEVVGSLEKSGFLENTYLIFTSDNGYHIGQFSQVYDKRQPYETDIKVPLVISGPGISKNVTKSQPALNIDLAPTIVSLAGIPLLNKMDGHSLDLFSESEVGDREFLIEYYGEGHSGTVDSNCLWKYDEENLAECYPMYDCKCQDARNNTFACLRHIGTNINLKFCMFNDQEHFKEYYDLSSDPFELSNQYAVLLPAMKNWYKLQLKSLLECKGASDCDRPDTYQ